MKTKNFFTFALCALISLPIISADYTQRDAEYNAEFTSAIELVCGQGFLCTGGPEKTNHIFKDIELSNKTMLDFGCGLGGLSIQLATQNSIAITAVDVEHYVITELHNRLPEKMKGSINPILITPNTLLPLESDSFDIIYAGESFLHVENKQLVLCEMQRILKPNGILILNDWLHSSPQHSTQMDDFLTADGLTFHLVTPDEYTELLEKAGFKIITIKNTSQETLDETNAIIDRFNGELGLMVKEKYGREYFEDYLNGWITQANVFKSGEMITQTVTATK